MKKKNNINKTYLEKKYFTYLGRDALFQAMKILSLDKDNKILLPSYVGMNLKEGSGIYDPIVSLNVGIEFYKINEDLSLDLDDLKKKMKSKNIKAVLLIHYFGFPQEDIQKVVEECKKNNVYLIEDCAHTMNSYFEGKKLGSFGDISFFSINKIMPTPNGGILVINNPKLEVGDIKETIEKESLIVYSRFDLKKASKKRVENYIYLDKQILNLKGVKKLQNKLPKEVTPLNYPILITEKDKNEVYFALNDKKIETTSLYHMLILPIKKEEYPISYKLSKSILNIPIHENISFGDIDNFIKIIKEILK